MVLSEAILITAYFLGLKRAYRLVLKTEKKVLRRVPRIQQFAERNIKHVFRLAHRGIKEVESRDMAFGKYLGSLVDKFPSWTFFKDKSIPRREKWHASYESMRAARASRKAQHEAESHGASSEEALKMVSQQEKKEFQGKAPGRAIEERVTKGEHDEGGSKRSPEDRPDREAPPASTSQKGTENGEYRAGVSGAQASWKEGYRKAQQEASASMGSSRNSFAAVRQDSRAGLRGVMGIGTLDKGVLASGRGASRQFVKHHESSRKDDPSSHVQSSGISRNSS